MTQLADYLDYVGTSVAPLPGQPGLFRNVPSRPLISSYRQPIAIPGYRPPPAPVASTAGYLRGLQRCSSCARGLGEVAASLTRTQAAHARFQALKTDVQQLINRMPTIEPTSFLVMARRISEMPRDTIVRLTADELATMLRAALSVVGSNLGLANAMLIGPNAAANEAKALKLVQTAEVVLTATDNVLYAINTARDAADRAARAVGLSDPVVIPTGALIAGIIAGAIVIVVAGVLLYTLFASISAAMESYQAAQQACDRDAAAGRPCTGEAWTEYREAAQAQQRESGVVPNFDGFFQRAGNTAIAVGVGVVALAIGYGLWVTAPAAALTRDRLARR